MGDAAVVWLLLFVVGIALVWSLVAMARWGHTYTVERRYYARDARYGYLDDASDARRSAQSTPPKRPAYRVPPSLA